MGLAEFIASLGTASAENFDLKALDRIAELAAAHVAPLAQWEL